MDSTLNFSKLTTLEIGGPIKDLIITQTTEELIETLRKHQGEKFLVIGGGSNLLVSDEGYEGLVIKNAISGINEDSGMIRVAAGTPLQEIVDFTIRQGLSGIQRMTGIPGTVGGAVYGNAGAYGQTISDYIEKVICFDGEDIKELSKEECGFSYRDSQFKISGFTIVEVFFKFTKADPQELEKESSETLEKRLAKYPPGIKCPGSFFKNVLVENLTTEQRALIPEEKDTFGKIPAWYFLDEVEARGAQRGQIKIADFHGNLFMNLGEGKASDFYDLAKEYADKVKEKFGIQLEPEVQLINLPPLA